MTSSGTDVKTAGGDQEKMQRIRDRLKEMNKQQQDMAAFVTERLRKATGNDRLRMSDVRGSEVMRGKKPFKAMEIPHVAAFLGWSGQQLLDLIAEQVPSSGPVKHMPVAADWGPNNLAVREARDIGGGLFHLSDEPVGTTDNIAQLLDVPSGFAIYMVTSEMDPKYQLGQMLYINPTVPAAPGQFALLCSKADEKGVRRHTVRLIVDITDDHFRVHQYNPARTYNLPRKDWDRAVKIMSSRER